MLRAIMSLYEITSNKTLIESRKGTKMDNHMSEEEKEAKFKALFERARKGVIRHIVDKGGSLSLDAMHEYSLNTYFIQHQRFSKLMETIVEEKLVEYDQATQVSTVTDAGRAFAEKSDS